MDELGLRSAGMRAMLLIILASVPYSERTTMDLQYSYYKPADRRIHNSQFIQERDDDEPEEFDVQTPDREAEIELVGDGRSVTIAGQTAKCGKNIRVSMSNRVPSEGVAYPGAIALNPSLLRRWPAMVQLFVFYHECGHHHVGAGEAKADCWAATKGVSEKWLSEESLAEICESFGPGNRRSPDGHPGGRDRCRYLKSCYQEAVANHGPVNAPEPVPEPQPERAPAEQIATRPPPVEIVNLPGMTIVYKGVR